MDLLGSKDSSRDLQLNCVISFYFFLYLIFYTFTTRFDTTGNLETFWFSRWTKQHLKVNFVHGSIDAWWTQNVKPCIRTRLTRSCTTRSRVRVVQMKQPIYACLVPRKQTHTFWSRVVCCFFAASATCWLLLLGAFSKKVAARESSRRKRWNFKPIQIYSRGKVVVAVGRRSTDPLFRRFMIIMEYVGLHIDKEVVWDYSALRFSDPLHVF